MARVWEGGQNGQEAGSVEWKAYSVWDNRNETCGAECTVPPACRQRNTARAWRGATAQQSEQARLG